MTAARWWGQARHRGTVRSEQDNLRMEMGTWESMSRKTLRGLMPPGVQLRIYANCTAWHVAIEQGGGPSRGRLKAAVRLLYGIRPPVTSSGFMPLLTPSRDLPMPCWWGPAQRGI